MQLRVKLRCWLLGLFPLILFGLFVGFLTKDTIEKDLEKRSIAALRTSGITWAQPAFTGLEGTIKGEAPSKTDREKATEIVRGVWGVRSVADQLSISKPISPYVFRSFHGKDKLVLEGYVPSVKIKQSVIGVAKAQFPNASLVDKLKIARGAPADGNWFGQISFGLGQLARFRKGHVGFSDKTLNITGAASDAATYKTLNDTLKGQLPLNMVAGSIEIQPPLIENYLFLTKYDASDVLIEGVLPNAATAEKIKRMAKTYFPNATVKSNIQVGSGAPKNWEKAVSLSLAELSKLDQGLVTLKKLSVNIEGVAATKDVATSIRKTVRSAYPTGYKVNDKITVKAVVIPVASPFETRAAIENNTITLNGVIESEEQRQDILNIIKTAHPELTVNDQLTIASGAPLGFASALKSGLSLLKNINNARLLLSDEQLTVSGDTKNETVANSYSEKPTDLPSNFSWVNGVKFDDSEKQEKEKAAQEKAAKAAADKKQAEEKAELEAKAAAEKAEALKMQKAAEEAKKKEEIKVTTKAELAKKKNWLTPEQTAKRLEDMHKESGAVNAKECQLLMNSLVRGNAIRFGVNSSVITSSSYDILSKVHSVADRCTNTVIRVEGHTDSDGSDNYNLQLSKRRAQSVVNYLIKLGIPRSRLDTKGFGEKKPVASNNKASGKALNRRIEFVVFEN